jgi:hypothetical protein
VKGHPTLHVKETVDKSVEGRRRDVLNIYHNKTVLFTMGKDGLTGTRAEENP